jgi:hypothetical protein
MAAGLAGGLVGAWAMNQVAPTLARLRETGARLAGAHAGDDRSEPRADEPRDPSPPAESSTVTVARVVSRRVLGHDLRPGTEAAAGNAVHYALGGVLGAVYGLLAAIVPAIHAGRGLLWGAIVWIAADETALPLLGLSGPPTQYRASTHALSFTGHCVYGTTTDLVRRALRPLLR